MAYLTLTDTISTDEPSGATAGVPLRYGRVEGAPREGFTTGEMLTGLTVLYKATVTAGQTATMSFLRLWGYHEVSATWYPAGPALQGGSDTARGYLNNAVALGEVDSGEDKIVLSQIVNGLSTFSRVYLQKGSSGGNGYSDEAWLQSMGDEV